MPVRFEPSPRNRLALPQVTLCAATSVNVQATLCALKASLEQIDFGACKLFTDSPVKPGHPAISVVPIARIESSAAYSDFLLSQMVDHVETSHCLIAQWDGHVIDAGRWLPEFLDYDYIGASWPQFDDDNDVGNGGFSLRSRRLMEMCRNQRFQPFHPEDLAIGRANRSWLEESGMRFAPRRIADMFSTERAGDLQASFGYHGVWHMPNVIGHKAFWSIYRDLDDRSTVAHDFASILRDMSRGFGGCWRMVRMIVDHVKGALKAGRM